MNRLVVRLTAAAVVLFILNEGGDALGQTRTLLDLYGGSGSKSTSNLTRKADDARRRSENQFYPSLYTPLEGAVDPETYLVGPNDQFTISIGGLQPVVSVALVSADGSLVLPGLGRVDAAGKTLLEVRETALAFLANSTVPIEIVLTRPREFYVHVTGAVPEPGRYVAQPVARLEDVLKRAFFTGGPETVDLGATFRPAFRNVVIKRRDGSESSYDIVQYYRTGDIMSNPYLQDGDAIYVPSYDPIRSSVFISGDIPYAGDYDFRETDTVLRLVRLGSGNLELDADRVIRHTSRNPDGTVITASYRLGDLVIGDPIPVHPLDHIDIPLIESNAGIAAADGWLKYPGQYPIEVGVTTLKDLVNMAGGFRSDALVRGAFLERSAALKKLQAPEVQPGTRYEVITDSSNALWQMRLGDFDFFSRQFLGRWLKMDERVSIQVDLAMRPDAAPVLLLNGDRLFVPQDEQAVYVIGEVVRPGRTSLMPGASASDYVDVVGGRGPRSGNTYVIRAGSGQIVEGGQTAVYSGDYLFVDRKGGETASLESERLRLVDQDIKYRSYQVLLQGIVAAATVITTTILLIDKFGN